MDEIPKVYIPDPTYYHPDYYPGLDEAEASERCMQELSAELNLSLKQTSIGAGADLPAFAAELFSNPALIGLIPLFFLGKPINENLEGWLSVMQKFQSALEKMKPVFNRSAALLYALFKYKNTVEPEITSIQLLEYQTFDWRIQEDLGKIRGQNKNFIADAPPEQTLGIIVHYFRILINEKEVSFVVYSNNIVIREN